MIEFVKSKKGYDKENANIYLDSSSSNKVVKILVFLSIRFIIFQMINN